MILQGLHQPPLNATLMGVLIGALRYHGSRVSDAWAYGASGHAFVMNVHKTLCPSGPYCWNREPFFAVARNVGVAVTDLGFFWSESPATEREGVERRLVAALDAGTPCGLVNMEYQLITGYDDTGFLTAQPWRGMDFPPAHLTFGTWAEMGAECHVNFLTLEKVAPVDEHRQVRDSLAYAVDLYRNPPRHSDGDYAVGAGAWGKFVDAVRAGEGASHGNWWNAMV